MLQNLIAQIDTEVASDEQDYGNFMTWFDAQEKATSSSIGMLSSRLQELAAVLADLRSRQHKLSTEVARLNAEISDTQDAIQQAKDKRAQEHESFVQEQLDFDNSIAACNKAVEILQVHYGDGKPKESTRPAWMSLLQSLQTTRRVSTKLSAKHVKLTALLEAAQRQMEAQAQTPGMRGSTLHTEYQGRGDEAQGIVGQVQQLAATFSEDKQSSIDQENELVEAFNTLMKEKTEQLHSLITQRDTQQAVLTQVNQEIGENENAEATAKATLQDEQAYLSRIQQQESDTTAMYKQRTHDRQEEKTAVSMAIKVLSQEAPSGFFLQLRSEKIRAHMMPMAMCPNCARAAALLKEKASTFHSELLATAAMTTGSGQALVPVIQQLQDLIHRLDEQQHAEEEHKAWCENELAETNRAKQHHEMLVTELKQKIEDSEAVIVEKKQAISDTMDAIKTADEENAEAERVRAKEKADFETELADYKDSIAALNQAIDILAQFYRDQDAALMQANGMAPMPADGMAPPMPMSFAQLAQVPVPGASAKADVPEMATLTGSYQRKGGGAVVKILKDTRQDFEAGQKNLEAEEAQAVADFEAAKAAYQKNRADLVDAGNRYAAELQTAQLALAQYQTDLASNEEKVQSLTSYLAQVGGSCNMLIENFAERTRLRNEEKEAINQAVGILQQAQ
jgi:chromosome segregation ATPase